MELVIRGAKIKVTDAMKSYIEEKIGKLDKYLEDAANIRATVVVKVKGHNQIIEVTIPLKSFILRSEESQEDFYAAVDKAVDKLERQIRKNKTRIISKNTKTYGFSLSEIEDSEEKEEKIIKRKKVEVKPMDEEEAIIQMELLNHQFYMYKDSETGTYAVVYKRKDGGYGIIESE